MISLKEILVKPNAQPLSYVDARQLIINFLNEEVQGGNDYLDPTQVDLFIKELNECNTADEFMMVTLDHDRYGLDNFEIDLLHALVDQHS